MDPIRDASVDKTMQANGITYEEVTKHDYDALMPDYAKELMKIYIKYLRLLKGLLRDITHRTFWRTKKRLIEEEGYNEDIENQSCKSKEISFATNVDVRRRHG